MNFNQSWIFEDPLEDIMRVELYIHLKTGKNIRISPHNLDLRKLKIAVSHANAYFREYNVTTTNI